MNFLNNGRILNGRILVRGMLASTLLTIFQSNAFAEICVFEQPSVQMRAVVFDSAGKSMTVIKVVDENRIEVATGLTSTAVIALADVFFDSTCYRGFDMGCRFTL